MPQKLDFRRRPGEDGHDWLARIWGRMLDRSEERIARVIEAAARRRKSRGPPDEPTEDEPTDKPP